MSAAETAAMPEPQPKSRLLRRLFAGKFLAVSIAVHLLFAAGATLWVVQSIQAQRKLTFHSGMPSPNPSLHALEHQVQIAKRKNTMSAPAVQKRITATALSKVTLPEMPAMPTMPALPSMMPTKMAGMGGAGLGLGIGGLGSGSGFGRGGGSFFTSSIGGLKIQAQRLAVALDVSGSVKQYQAAMREHVAKTFKGSEVAEFKSAGFNPGGGKGQSMGAVALDFLNSPKKFDAIYIFSDFGETRDEQSQWLEVKNLIKEKKVRLYLHVLREPAKEGKINPVLAEVIAFAKETGGSVKIGPMMQVGDASESNPSPHP